MRLYLYRNSSPSVVLQDLLSEGFLDSARSDIQLQSVRLLLLTLCVPTDPRVNLGNQVIKLSLLIIGLAGALIILLGDLLDALEVQEIAVSHSHVAYTLAKDLVVVEVVVSQEQSGL